MRRRCRLAIAAVLVMAGALVVGSTPTAVAAHGDLDPGFAEGGQAFLDLSTGHGSPAGVVTQPDGSVVSVATASPTPLYDGDQDGLADVVVERRRADGTLDEAFGSGGTVVLDLDGTHDEAGGVALQPDGAIVVAGTTSTELTGDGRSTPGGDVAFVARLLPSGALDPGFGDGGVVVAHGGDGGGVLLSAARAVLVQPDGRILVGGGDDEYRVLGLRADGSVDDEFGSGGIAYAGGGGWPEHLRGLALQPDGAIVGAGSSGSGVGVFRLTPQGQVDYSFGTYGMVRTDFGEGEEAEGAAVVVRPDGTIAVAGYAGNALLVLRHTASGALDESFAGGYVTERLGEGSDAAHTITAVGERVVVGGRLADGATLLSYDADGARSAGFGEDGEARVDGLETVVAVAPAPGDGLAVAGEAGADAATTVVEADGAPRTTYADGGAARSPARATADEVTAVAVEDDGDVVLAGHSATGSGWDFAAVRLTADGSVNYAFPYGAVTVDVGGEDDRLHAVDVYADGTAVLAGDAHDWSGASLAIVKLGAVGERVPGFGSDGVVTLDLAEGDEQGARGVVALPGGAVLVAGFADDGMVVVRLLPDGTRDPGFGADGVVRLMVDGAWTQATGLAVAPDGGIRVAGEVAENQVGSASTGPSAAAAEIDDRFDGNRDVAVVALTADGALDEAFGDGGTTTVDLTSGDDRATGIAVDGEGRTIVTTSSWRPPWQEAPPGPLAGVVALTPGGDLDEGFGDGGTVLADELPGVPPLAGTVGVAVTPDGAVTLANRAPDGAIEVLRLAADGTPDGDFGDGGMIWTGFDGAHGTPRAIAARPDGTVLVGGSSRGPGAAAFAVIAVTATGAADPGFNGGVCRVVEVAGTSDELRAAAVLPDGSVVAAGEARVGPAGDLAVARLLPDGSGDPSFGWGWGSAAGAVVTDVSGGADGAHAIAVQPDGKIVVAGFAGPDAVVARFEPYGSLDWYFGEGGVRVLDFDDGAQDEARALAILPDGSIMVAGNALFRGNGSRNPSWAIALARLTPDGALDDTFGSGGTVVTGEETWDHRTVVTSMAMRPDGSVVVAGSRDDRVMLAGHTADGAPDPAFGAGGVPGMPGMTLLDDVAGEATGVVARPDGSVVAVAAVADELVAAAVDGAGARVGSTARVPLGGGAASGGVVLQADGSLVAAASVMTDGSPVYAADRADAALVRLRADLSPDPGFGVDGVAPTGGPRDTAIGVALHPDGVAPAGALVAVGAAGSDATVTRVVGGDAEPITTPADLAVTVTAAVQTPPSALVGEPVRHAVQVRNDGPHAADGVRVTATVTGGATLLGTTAGQGEECVVPGDPSPPETSTTPPPTEPPTEPTEPPTDTPPTDTPPTDTPPTDTPAPATQGPTVASTSAAPPTGQPTGTPTGPTEPTGPGEPGGSAEPAAAPDVELSCGLGSLDPGATVSLTITVAADRPTTVVATVRVSSDEPDPDASDDEATVSTVVVTPLTVARVPEVRVNPGVVRLGRVVAVTGSGFDAGLPVTIGYTGDSASRAATVGPDGVLTTRVVVFPETMPGSRQVEVRGPDGAVLATVRLLVVIESGSPPDFVGRG